MPITRNVLELYKNITSGTSDATQNFVPAAGPFRIIIQEAESGFDLNVAVKIMFDGALVFETKGNLVKEIFKERVGDAVKKVELVLDATDLPAGSALLGGKLTIEQET